MIVEGDEKIVEGVPIVLILLVSILVISIVFGFLVWRKNLTSGISLFSYMDKKVFLIQLSTGVILSLFAAFLMFNGEIFGENTTGIARIIGIVSIFLIATSSATARVIKGKSASE